MWRFVLTWIWATLVGWIVTVIIMVGSCFVIPLYFSFSRQELEQSGFNGILLILSIAFATAMLGFAQWKLALQGSVSMWQWIACNLVGVGLAWLTENWGHPFIPQWLGTASGSASGVDISFHLLDAWPQAVLVMSIWLGLSIGLPQSAVLYRYNGRALWWPGITAAGVLGALLMVAFIIYVIPFILLNIGPICFIAPATFALITGIGLFKILSARPKSSADTSIVQQR